MSVPRLPRQAWQVIFVGVFFALMCLVRVTGPILADLIGSGWALFVTLAMFIGAFVLPVWAMGWLVRNGRVAFPD